MKAIGFKLIFTLAVLFLQASSHAASWTSLGKNETVDVYYDAASISGIDAEKIINIKFNFIGAAKEGAKSHALQFSINCNDRTYLLQSLSYYAELDLGGAEKVFELKNQKRNEAKVKTFSDMYVNAACNAGGEKSANASQAQAKTASVPEKVPARTPDFLITKSQKRPDGTLDMIEAVDLNSIDIDWNRPLSSWLVDVRTGRPIDNNIESLPAVRLSSDCQDQYAKICEVGKRNYLQALSRSVNPDDQLLKLSPQTYPNLSKQAPASRVSNILNKWIGTGDFSNGINYDVVAFADVTFYLVHEGFDPSLRAKWNVARNEFGSLITKIAAATGVPSAEVLAYFGINPKTFFGVWGGRSLPNKFGSKARDDFYGYYQANLDKFKHQRGRYQGFPHDYAPDQLLGEYFPGQFKKYGARANELVSIRDSMESNIAAFEDSKRKASEFASSPEGVKQAQKYALEQKRKDDEAAAALVKEFPYYAVITCGFSGQHINVMACFGSGVNTELELKNGQNYGLYQSHEITRLGRESAEGLVINLKSNFAIKVQNSSDNLILGMKVYNRSSKALEFQKQVSRWGVISANR